VAYQCAALWNWPTARASSTRSMPPGPTPVKNPVSNKEPPLGDVLTTSRSSLQFYYVTSRVPVSALSLLGLPCGALWSLGPSVTGLKRKLWVCLFQVGVSSYHPSTG
jgi:hypothetical protein